MQEFYLAFLHDKNFPSTRIPSYFFRVAKLIIEDDGSLCIYQNALSMDTHYDMATELKSFLEQQGIAHDIEFSQSQVLTGYNRVQITVIQTKTPLDISYLYEYIFQKSFYDTTDESISHNDLGMNLEYHFYLLTQTQWDWISKEQELYRQWMLDGTYSYVTHNHANEKCRQYHLANVKSLIDKQNEMIKRAHWSNIHIDSISFGISKGLKEKWDCSKLQLIDIKYLMTRFENILLSLTKFKIQKTLLRLQNEKGFLMSIFKKTTFFKKSFDKLKEAIGYINEKMGVHQSFMLSKLITQTHPRKMDILIRKENEFEKVLELESQIESLKKNVSYEIFPSKSKLYHYREQCEHMVKQLRKLSI